MNRRFAAIAMLYFPSSKQEFRWKGMRRHLPNPRMRMLWLCFALMLVLSANAGAEDGKSTLLQKADVMTLEVFRLFKAGRYEEALPLAKQVLEIREKEQGPRDPATANALFNLAAQYRSLGKLTLAEPLYRRALNIREEVLGREHPDTILSVEGLAQVYQAMGLYAKAVPLLERLLSYKEKTLPKNHPDTLIIMNNLGMAYLKIGEFTKAEVRCRQALAAEEKSAGPEDPSVATTLINLANLYQEVGAVAQAEPLFRQALVIREKAFGPNHPATAVALSNLGVFYGGNGEYDKAEPPLLRALAIAENVLGPEHPETATKLGNVAKLYEVMGDYTKAEPLALRALAIREKKFGPAHPEIASSLDQLGELYTQMRRHAEAETFYARALAMREQLFGPDHPEVAMSLNNLAEHYHEVDNYAKAIPLQERALALTEKFYGARNHNSVATIINLASLYIDQGEYAKAESLVERALSIKKSVDTLEAAVTLYLQKGDRDRVHDYGSQLVRAEETKLKQILSFADERRRLTFQKSELNFNIAVMTGTPPEIAQTLLRWKGVVLDSIMEERAMLQQINSADLERQLADLQMLKAQAMKLTLEQPSETDAKSSEGRTRELDLVERRIASTEGTMARKVTALGKARQALGVTVEEVQARIPENSALVEFARYYQFAGGGKKEHRYGAMIISPHGVSQWVPLGYVDEIEPAISRYSNQVRDKETDDATLTATLHELYNRLWEPIEKLLPAQTSAVIISPDAQINFISFATLLSGDEKFLAERYAFEYVTTGRDLLRDVKRTANQEAVIFANPAFAGTVQDIAPPNVASRDPMRGDEQRSITNLHFNSLDGALKEGNDLRADFEHLGLSTRLLPGEQATKAALWEVRSPTILHLATHGFFAPERLAKTADGNAPSGRKGFFANPMHCSGLALTGAQATIDAWKEGKVPSRQNDGIVTAEEVGVLHLDGTWLVTLSACDTGRGEARSGEGILGLRRGFVEAGTQNLLVTLWPIRDALTGEIMRDFYSTALHDNDAPRALANVQCKWLKKLRDSDTTPGGGMPKPRITQAVNVAGAFIMTFQGKP